MNGNVNSIVNMQSRHAAHTLRQSNVCLLQTYVWNDVVNMIDIVHEPGEVVGTILGGKFPHTFSESSELLLYEKV